MAAFPHRPCRRFRRPGAVLAMALAAGACGKLEKDPHVVLEMVAANEIPPGADGSQDPRSLSLTLTACELVTAAGATVSAHAPDAPAPTRVVDRPQIIFDADMGDHAGTSFTGVRLTFGSAISALDKDGKAVLGTLPTTTLDASLPFTLSKNSDGVTIRAKLPWLRTIKDGTLLPPAVVLSVD